jgi:hypothetical protein
VICDEIRKRHGNFVMDQRISCSVRSFMESARGVLLTVISCIKVHLDLQAEKSPVVVKGPFFPRVVNLRYRIRGTNV